MSRLCKYTVFIMLLYLRVHLQHQWLHLQCSLVVFVLEPQTTSYSVGISIVLLLHLVNSFLLCSHGLHSLFPLSVFFSVNFNVVNLLLGQEVVGTVCEALEVYGVFGAVREIDSADLLCVDRVFWDEGTEALGGAESAWAQTVRLDCLYELWNRGILFGMLL